MSDGWDIGDQVSQGFYRTQSVVSRVTLKLGDDTKPVQIWQTEGFPGEIRSGVQRLHAFGISTMPLTGAKAHVTYQGGNRGFGTITNVEDPRYRPKGLKGGETHVYMVDGAQASDGTGGTLRTLLKGAIGWLTTLLGKTITIGDVNTTTITITGSTLIKLVGPVEITGTLKVDGKTTVQDIDITGTETGGGTA
jgi:phage baseplate assembly protein V